MAKPTNQRKPTQETMRQNNQRNKKSNKHHSPKSNSTDQKPPPSWAVMRGIFSCKHQNQNQQIKQQPAEKKQKQKQKQEVLPSEETSKKNKKMKCSGSLCSNTKVMHRPPESISPEALQRKKAAAAAASSLGHCNSSSSSNNNAASNGSSSRSLLKSSLPELSNNSNGVVSSSTNSSLSAVSSTNNSGNGGSGGGGGGGGSFRGMGLSRFSGCYECRMVVDPVLGFARDPSLRGSICSCPDCGEIFMKAENLELHQAVRHAVSELGPEDTSKNIVEIIFQSSWLKKETSICKIDRILKVRNTQRTISKFEEYRDSIKAKATKLARKHPRCIADGNELLRFHSTTFNCSLGLNGSSNLCNSIPSCSVCSIIKNGFKVAQDKNNINGNNGKMGNFGGGGGYNGILTTATSGKAHDRAGIVMEDEGGRRAMLVCRVIAGRVKKGIDGNGNNNMEDYDSVAGAVGMYSNLDELYVFNPRAILPCFVVIYSGF